MTQSLKTWLEQLRRLRTTRGRQQAGQYSMEGYRLIERALRAGTSLAVVLVDEALLHDPTHRWQVLESELQKYDVPVFSVSSDGMEEFVGKRTFGSMIAIADLPTPPPLSEFLKQTTEPTGILVLDRVMDHGNMGAMMRTALASGIRALISLKGGDPFHPKAVRTSMGALFVLPIYCVEDEQELLTLLRSTGWHSVGAVVEGGVLAHETSFAEKTAMFMGSEAHGLSPWLQKHLDSRCTIPMVSIVDSFSVNAATAILLYEWNRQKVTKGGEVSG